MLTSRLEPQCDLYVLPVARDGDIDAMGRKGALNNGLGFNGSQIDQRADEKGVQRRIVHLELFQLMAQRCDTLSSPLGARPADFLKPGSRRDAGLQRLIRIGQVSG